SWAGGRLPTQPPSLLPKEFSMNRPSRAGAVARNRIVHRLLGFALLLMPTLVGTASASELDLALPTLEPGQRQLLMIGLGVCVFGMLFGWMMYNQVKNLPAHKSMTDVSAIIYETCKT